MGGREQAGKEGRGRQKASHTTLLGTSSICRMLRIR